MSIPEPDPRALAWVQQQPRPSAGVIRQVAGRGLVTVCFNTGAEPDTIEIAAGWENYVNSEQLVGLVNAALAGAQHRAAGLDQLVASADPEVQAARQRELAAIAMESAYAPGLDLDLVERRYLADPQAADEALAAALGRIDAARTTRVQPAEPQIVWNPRRTLGFTFAGGHPARLHADPRWADESGGRLSRELNEFLSEHTGGKDRSNG